MLLAAIASLTLSQAAPPPPVGELVDFGPREARHLLSRAGFGAPGEELAAWVELGHAGAVRRLLEPPVRDSVLEEIEPWLVRWEDFGRTHRQGVLYDSAWFRLSAEERTALYNASRVKERAQFFEMERCFYDAALRGDHPLRERMALFWHGFFTTSGEVYKRKFELISQFQWLRRNALGSYAELLHGIVRNPAMLNYLDNSSNFREHPNENLARELMEIYSLGEGHFDERDVREAARALTGHAGGSDGLYEFLPEEHDFGEKEILGVRGPLDAGDLVEILLAQEACAVHVAGRLLRHFEGLEPEAERLENYADSLRESGYDVRAFLRRLFLDPDFYRREVVATRVTPPIELLVATCRRLGLEPSAPFLHYGAYSMGQTLYLPPTVKGWPDGLAWLEGDAIFRRGNVMGLLVGDITDDSEELPIELRRLREHLDEDVWSPLDDLLPRLRSAPPADTRDLARSLAAEWIAVEAPASTLSWIEGRALSLLEEEGCTLTDLLADDEAAVSFLRELAHLVLSLPEAQLS